MAAAACLPWSSGFPRESPATRGFSRKEIEEIAGVFPPELLLGHPHPRYTMKFLLFIPVLGLAFFASSCRTSTPIDPNTMKPTEQCLPQNFHVAPPTGAVHATK
jgi:hypothetical protein